MAFNKLYNEKFRVRRKTLRELVKAMQEFEAKGFECVAPFKRIYKAGKKYDRDARSADLSKSRVNFSEGFDCEFYEVWMRGVKQ